MPVNLQSLSPELRVMILQYLSSPKDLGSTIKASSQFYHAFSAYSQSIQLAILLRAIPPEVEADFVLALRAQEVWQFVTEYDNFEGDDKNLRQKCSDVLKQFQSERSESLYKLVSDRTYLMESWKLYSHFEYFMISYTARALLQLDQPPFNTISLSDIEQTRLQRAFFRCEIYTCLFQASQTLHYHSQCIRSDEPVSVFATMLSSWELEEISCIAQFYNVLMEELFDRIEDDFVKSMKEKMHYAETNRGKLLNEQPTSLDNNTKNWAGMLDYFSLSHFGDNTKLNCHTEDIEYLITRGMLAMRKLTNAPLSISRKMVLQSHGPAENHLRLLYALTSAHYRDESLKVEPAKSDSETESLQHCNFAWKWAVGSENSMEVNAPANYHLRNQGYVFWDKARITTFEIFKTPRALEDCFFEFYDFPSDYVERSEIPGAEVRLEGFSFPIKFIEEISHEIYNDSEGGRREIDWRK